MAPDGAAPLLDRSSSVISGMIASASVFQGCEGKNRRSKCVASAQLTGGRKRTRAGSRIASRPDSPSTSSF